MGVKCARIGCTSVAVGKGYCLDHTISTVEASEPHRYDYSSISVHQSGPYSSPKWRAMRRIHLNGNPLCDCCAMYGMTRVAVDVDHVVPHRGNARVFADKGNLSSLCKACHSSKTGAEKRGLWLDYRNNCIATNSSNGVVYGPIVSTQSWSSKQMKHTVDLGC